MYKLKFTNAYKKSYKRMVKRSVDVSLLDEIVDNLRQGIALDPKYKNHILLTNSQPTTGSYLLRNLPTCVNSLSPTHIFLSVNFTRIILLIICSSVISTKNCFSFLFTK